MNDKPVCSGRCVPIMDQPPARPQSDVLYAVKCKNCGYDILFCVKRPKRPGQLKEIVLLGEEDRPLNLPVRIDPSFMEQARKYGHLYQLTKPDKKEFEAKSREGKMNILYEMIADGDIDEDMFNTLSSRF
ncbi:hypothetical protein [Dyadobacter sp. CY323]|uniref:hypothetical protein n=1 Tax=Dyadobacter sp. CY323 TaxID=2907302 RepID=UPI001F32F746|nr:hypothetical protein [Dyadobacter sp. CY323]MCE6992082.1 hypothetical protein [Dyadobacter sp. CY323]